MMHETDLLVIGTGVGGASAALQAADAGLRVTVLTAAHNPLDSNSFWAQGGIIYKAPGAGEQASLAADIKRAGAGRCEDGAVAKLAAEGPAAVERFLLPGGLKHGDFGVAFDRKEDAHGPSQGESLGLENSVARRAAMARWFIGGHHGEEEGAGEGNETKSALLATEEKQDGEKGGNKKEENAGPGAGLALCLEGSHSRPRIIHWGDQTGKAMMESLVKALDAHPLVTLLRGATALDLIVVNGEKLNQPREEEEGSSNNAGAVVDDSASTAERETLAAKEVEGKVPGARRCGGAVVLVKSSELNRSRSLGDDHPAAAVAVHRKGKGKGRGKGFGKGKRAARAVGGGGKGSLGREEKSPGSAGDMAVCSIVAHATILATGGCGEVWEHTSNPPSSRGDGLAMALRVGAQVSNMEFMQFHPTTLHMPGERRFLLTEALRGEGALLLDPLKKEAFARKYHDDGELAPRDVVSRMILKEMSNAKDATQEEGRWWGDQDERSPAPCCFLDIRHRGSCYLKRRFPAIFAHCLARGLDMGVDLLPVVPAAHYFCGGVRVDLEGRSSVPGLYAAGEVSCTGLHGANRLASTSLLEGLVWGASAADAAAAAINETSPAVAARAAAVVARVAAAAREAAAAAAVAETVAVAAAPVAPPRALERGAAPRSPPLRPREQKARWFFGGRKGGKGGKGGYGGSSSEDEGGGLSSNDSSQCSSVESSEEEEVGNDCDQAEGGDQGRSNRLHSDARINRTPPSALENTSTTTSSSSSPPCSLEARAEAKVEAAKLTASWGEVKGTMWAAVGIVRRPRALALAAERLSAVAADAETAFQRTVHSIGLDSALRLDSTPSSSAPSESEPVERAQSGVVAKVPSSSASSCSVVALSTVDAERLGALCGLRNASAVAAAIAAAAAANGTSVGTHFIEPDATSS